MSLSANSIQVRYIEQVKSTVINSKSKKIIFTPDLLRDGKKAENFYLKPSTQLFRRTIDMLEHKVKHLRESNMWK